MLTPSSTHVRVESREPLKATTDMSHRPGKVANDNTMNIGLCHNFNLLGLTPGYAARR